MANPVVSASSQVLAHAPGMARHGSKPRRELSKDPEVERAFLASLRSFDQAVAYAPHQAWLGAVHPRNLPERPWVRGAGDGSASRFGPAGELLPEEELLGLLAALDQFELVVLDPGFVDRAAAALAAHPLAKPFDIERIDKAVGDVEAVAGQLRSLGAAGFDEVLVRHLAEVHEEVLASFTRLAEVRALVTDA